MKEQTIARQVWRIPNYRASDDKRPDNTRGGTFEITAEITKFANQEPYFSMTGWYKSGTDEWGGCCHDEIVNAMPTLDKYIKWHLCSTSGPMHYVANTVWHAGDRDCWGRRAGDVSRYEYGVQFGDSPITTRVNKLLWTWLDSGNWYEMRHDIMLVEVPHTGTDGRVYSPHYTFTTLPCQWHECPFKDRQAGWEFLSAMQELQVRCIQVPVEYSTGKERDFEAARRTAIWPEATDDELSLDRDDLARLLNARLPALLDAFQADMIELFGDQIQFIKE